VDGDPHSGPTFEEYTHKAKSGKEPSNQFSVGEEGGGSGNS
jgi:hypothetical protein